MTPNLIGQGVLVADKQVYSPNTHISEANLFGSMFKGQMEKTDLGLIKTWTQIWKNVQPLYNFDSIAKSTIYTESGEVTYQTAIAYEDPKIVEDLSDTDKPGIDGQEFRLAFDKAFTVSQTISYDHINNDFQLIVTKEPYSDGDRWIHHVKIWGGSGRTNYISKEYLAAGTTYYQLSSHRGDNNDTIAASFKTDVGERNWHYYLGSSETAYDFHIDKKSVILLNAGKNTNSDYRAWELVKFAPGSEGYKYMLGDPSVNLSKIQEVVYKGDRKAMTGDIKGANWFFEIEKATMDKTTVDYIMNLMWGTGGRTQLQYDTVSATPGLYWQHKTYGNVRYYNLNQFSLDYLRSNIEQHFRNRLDFNQDGEILLKVGSGAYNIIEEEIKKEFSSLNIVINSDDPRKFLGGSSRFELNATMRFKSFFLKQFPKTMITMVYEPALDPIQANNISNPYVDGKHRLSSYTMILYSLNDIEADNIKLIKWKYDDKMRYKKQVGNVDWQDQNATFFSSGNFSGMKGEFSTKHAGVLLVDPTKSLMFELINPYTKVALRSV